MIRPCLENAGRCRRRRSRRVTRPQSRATKHLRPSVLPVRASAESRRRPESVFGLSETMHVVTDSASNHGLRRVKSMKSEALNHKFECNSVTVKPVTQTTGAWCLAIFSAFVIRHSHFVIHHSFRSITPFDATMLYLSFMFSRGRRSTVPPAFSTRSQPAAMSHKLIPCFNVSVESSAGDVGHIERGAAEHAAFAHAMNHFLEQRKVRVDRLRGFGEPDRDNRFSKIRAITHMERDQPFNFGISPFCPPKSRREADRRSRRP